MAISTALIGRLGRIETQETRIDDNTTTTIPAGWRKAAGVFRGQMVYGKSNGTVFDTSLRPIGSGYTVPVNGGGCSQPEKPRRSATSQARSRGTGSSNPWGGGLDGGKLTDHRNPRRQRGQNLGSNRSLPEFGNVRRDGEAIPSDSWHGDVGRVWPGSYNKQLHNLSCGVRRYRAGELTPLVVA